jgi:hypothetical protein
MPYTKRRYRTPPATGVIIYRATDGWRWHMKVRGSMVAYSIDAYPTRFHAWWHVRKMIQVV